jgi:hypothetical protein
MAHKMFQLKLLAADELLLKLSKLVWWVVRRCFSSHLKWQRIKNLNDPKKYVVCNASEGEIGDKRIFTF